MVMPYARATEIGGIKGRFDPLRADQATKRKVSLDIIVKLM
jgi:hypothetical protein